MVGIPSRLGEPAVSLMNAHFKSLFMQRRASHKPTYKGQLHFRPNTEDILTCPHSPLMAREHKTGVLIISAQ